MANVIISGDTSGAITLAAPAVAGTNTISLPASTGTLVVTSGAQTIEFAAGTVSAPAITTTGDTNTGIFFPAADTIAFTEGGTESMRLNSSGSLGIGTTNPLTPLHVVGAIQSQRSGAAQYARMLNSAGTATFISDNQASGAYTGFEFQGLSTASGTPVTYATIDGNGNVFLNTTSSVGGAPSQQAIVFDGQNKFGIGLRTSYASLGSYYIAFVNSANTLVGRIEQNGATTVAYTTSSDYRLKENIAPMTGALAKVALLKPVTYQWKLDGSDGQGFIAHELQEVVPDCVTGEKDAMRTEQYEISPAIPATYDDEGNELTPVVEAVMGEREVPQYQGIDTSFLVATLTAAIQEQQAIITQLQADVAALKGAA
jgi:hypothetical protein